ncbi:hypothetical protein NC796_03895 [Aliifodinibius sp. S!AR15-10]|uniref:hypothetical protein n=1 Tax=Aliifodinibius sp. S!AR15-10 TaxID=2950437 RepID=UPI002858CBDB|nr:hypothetical protein [Aliifodinibius sp. S!AR15-10]MDR8390269.1 hypothetical protein [Aliifodinibius sp. S!AR15-10]
MSAMKGKSIFIIPILFLVLFTDINAQSSTSSLDISKPPTGELSEGQLTVIANDIRRLESHPLAHDAKQARAHLFKWISGSPDIHVQICSGIIGPLLESESKYQGELLMQFLLSGAAYAIENPKQRDNKTAIAENGIIGALNTYNIFKEIEGEPVRDDFMERMTDLRKQDKLRQYVEEGVKSCQ